MGQKDNAQNDYFKDKALFADACNGILFHGREIGKEEMASVLINNLMDSLRVSMQEAKRMLKIMEDNDLEGLA